MGGAGVEVEHVEEVLFFSGSFRQVMNDHAWWGRPWGKNDPGGLTMIRTAEMIWAMMPGEKFSPWTT